MLAAIHWLGAATACAGPKRRFEARAVISASATCAGLSCSTSSSPIALASWLNGSALHARTTHRDADTAVPRRSSWSSNASHAWRPASPLPCTTISNQSPSGCALECVTKRALQTSDDSSGRVESAQAAGALGRALAKGALGAAQASVTAPESIQKPSLRAQRAIENGSPCNDTALHEASRAPTWGWAGAVARSSSVWHAA